MKSRWRQTEYNNELSSIFDKLKDFEVHDYGPGNIKLLLFKFSLKESFDNEELKDDINKSKEEIKTN